MCVLLEDRAVEREPDFGAIQAWRGNGMITDREIWDYEKARLDRVIKELEKQLEDGRNAVRNFKKEAIDLQKEMWEEVKCAPTGLTDLEDATQIWQYQAALSRHARKYRFSYDRVGRLERMVQSPYFGRIDFIEDGEEKAEQIYIGIHNLTVGSTMEVLVYDWRAPISSMFYDFETGLCGYECPAGWISGKMPLKRQYKIENGQIVYMFDSSVSINDEMLREILGKSTDVRMKTIVTSIQREQNAVIRDSRNEILIVEGPAGSGKTSIALHRAAYLLYKHRDHIKSENVLVFSPNHVFEDYISSVLPELGEENIRRNTFADFFGSLLGTEYRIETMNQQMEYLLSGQSKEIRLDCIRFKSSPAFLAILKRYLQHLENGAGMRFETLVYKDEAVISGEDIFRLFTKDYSYLPYARRLEKLRQRLFYLLEQQEEKRAADLSENPSLTEEEKAAEDQKAKLEYESLEKEIVRVTSFEIGLLYGNLFRNIELFSQPAGEQEIEEYRRFGTYTLRQLEQNILRYEDLAPVLFLKTALDTVSDAKSIKHVIIDEAQDYTVVQYEIFKNVFGHCNMTILGDVNQSVNGYMNIGSWDIIPELFKQKGTKSISLTKSYRSSKEIADFCREILMAGNRTEQMERHGSKPKIIKTEKRDLHQRIAEDILELKSRNHKLIAVICKTTGQCEALYKSLHSCVEISLISNQNEVYQGEVVIIPSYLAKGLEFDAVLAGSVEEADYSKEEDRRILYTICTRALHELYLYYCDNISGFVKEIGEDFYTKA
jgi:DNA helicase-2/ATP-dependent DNA helicase PcrA